MRATGGFVELGHGLVGNVCVVDDVEEAGEAVVDGGVDGAVAGRGGASPRRLVAALLRRGRGRGFVAGQIGLAVGDGRFPLELWRAVLWRAARPLKLTLDHWRVLDLPGVARRRGDRRASSFRGEAAVRAAGQGPQKVRLQTHVDGLGGLRASGAESIGLAGGVSHHGPGRGSDSVPDGDRHLLHVVTHVPR